MRTRSQLLSMTTAFKHKLEPQLHNDNGQHL
jgi:hypothetical protein